MAELMPASAPPELSAFKIAMLDYRMVIELLTGRAQVVKNGLEFILTHLYNPNHHPLFLERKPGKCLKRLGEVSSHTRGGGVGGG